MKKTGIIVLIVFTLASCGARKQTTKTTEEAQIGGDKNAHGCLVGAGQSWSRLKQECIQVFAVGIRLDPVEQKKGEAVISSFVVFNDDKSKLELFLPGDKNTYILDKTKGNRYQKGKYKFDAETSVLYVNNKEKYRKE